MANSIDVLNRLLAIHNRSLPMYLNSAPPWISRSDEKAREVLNNVVADHRQSVENLGRAIIAAGKPVNMGEYPMLFTDIHDLSMAHVLRELIRSQKQDIQTIVDCVQELEEDPPNRNFAEECLGAAKGHLEALEGLGVAANVVG